MNKREEKWYLERKDLLPRFVPLSPDLVSVYHEGLTWPTNEGGGSRFALSFNSSNWCRCPRHKPFHRSIPTFRSFLAIGFCSHHNFSCHGRLPAFRTQGKVSNILASFIILPLLPFLCHEAIWCTYISIHWNLANITKYLLYHAEVFLREPVKNYLADFFR